jgi:hypothetical protein
MSSEYALSHAVADLIRWRRRAASAGLPIPLPATGDSAEDADERVRFLASLLEESNCREIPEIRSRSDEMARVAATHADILGRAEEALATLAATADAHGASSSVHFATWHVDQGSRALTRPHRRVLLRWLFSHRQHPYATVADLDLLARSTGLTHRQIQTFLVNWRRRHELIERPDDISCVYPWMYE